MNLSVVKSFPLGTFEISGDRQNNTLKYSGKYGAEITRTKSTGEDGVVTYSGSREFASGAPGYTWTGVGSLNTNGQLEINGAATIEGRETPVSFKSTRDPSTDTVTRNIMNANGNVIKTVTRPMLPVVAQLNNSWTA